MHQSWHASGAVAHAAGRLLLLTKLITMYLQTSMCNWVAHVKAEGRDVVSRKSKCPGKKLCLYCQGLALASLSAWVHKQEWDSQAGL